MLGNMAALKRASASKRYTYRIPAFLSLDTRVDGQVSPDGVSPYAYNVEMGDGALRRCKGFSRAKKYSRYINGYGYLPQLQGIKRIFSMHNSYGEVDIYPLCDDGLYKESTGLGQIEYSKVDNKGDTELMFEYMGKNENGEQAKYILRSGSTGLEVSGADKQWVLTDCGFTSGVIFAERFFGVGAYANPNRIFFSAQFLPYEFTPDFDKGGYIDVDPSYGKARDMLVMGDCIYVIWEYGITRLKAYGYQSEFVLSGCYKSTSRILRGAKICGSSMVFVSQDGIHSFDGGNVKRIGEQIFSFIDVDGCDTVVSGFDDDRYYLAVHSNDFDGEGNNIVLKYDLRDGKWSIFTVRVSCMERLNLGNGEELVFISDNGMAYVFDGSNAFGEDPIPAKWCSAISGWGRPESVKEIKAIYLSVAGTGRLTVTVESEQGMVTKSFFAQGERRVVRIPIRLRGRLMRLMFENCDGCDFVIAEPVVIFTLEQGR